jgi:hypothetical protein
MRSDLTQAEREDMCLALHDALEKLQALHKRLGARLPDDVFITMSCTHIAMVHARHWVLTGESPIRDVMTAAVGSSFCDEQVAHVMRTVLGDIPPFDEKMQKTLVEVLKCRQAARQRRGVNLTLLGSEFSYEQIIAEILPPGAPSCRP